MSNKKFLLSIIEFIATDEQQKCKNWRGTLSSWIKC